MPALTTAPLDNQDQTGGAVSTRPRDDQQFLQLANAAFSASTSYFDTAVRSRVLNNIRQFQGQFPQGSKYLSDAYRGRSKFFRPKTRSVVRKNEAIAAEAFFSSMDVISIKPHDEDNAQQRASAEMNKALLQYRLTTKGKNGIPWFLISSGANQDSQVQGLVCSYQSWEINERKGIDRPRVDLLPIENIRFDPNCDWWDPVNSSPYFIQLIPMWVKDVKARMVIDAATGTSKWRPMSDAQLKQASSASADVVRLQREQGRVDPRAQNSGITDYTIVWVRRIIAEIDGSDWVWHTLGDTALLDDPKPIEQMWFHGRRPYVIGFSVIETHKTYPGGDVELIAPLQAELNENANQRLDNVKFAMNKRYFAKRTAAVDLRSLQRNVPSSVTLMNDPENDVKVVDTPDVTASAYQEQDRLQLDIDDVSGSFSQASVQANRKLNETVGGMNILTKDASQVTGYKLRTFAETWMEPVLEQLVLLEQFYETDEVILSLCGRQADLYTQFGIDTITDKLLMQSLMVNVNVGLGATNPHDQLGNFMEGMKALHEVLADGVLERYGMDVAEVIKEVFSKLGYKDGKRFFPEQNDPRIAGLLATIQELQKALDAKMPPELLAATVEKVRAEAKKALATTLKTNVESAYSSVQTAEVIAAVPGVAPVADEIMRMGGYTPPVPAGVDPNFPQPTGPIDALGVSEVANKRTGISFMPGGGAPPAAGQPGGPAPGDTSPQTPMKPAAPASPGTGAATGINTMRADG